MTTYGYATALIKEVALQGIVHGIAKKLYIDSEYRVISAKDNEYVSFLNDAVCQLIGTLRRIEHVLIKIKNFNSKIGKNFLN